MTTASKTPLDGFRLRQKRQGLVRVELQVRKKDAAFVRGVAKALVDPAREAEARSLLKTRFATHHFDRGEKLPQPVPALQSPFARLVSISCIPLICMNNSCARQPRRPDPPRSQDASATRHATIDRGTSP